MLGLTTLGVVHTVISLVAVACGLSVLAREREISTQTLLGRIYLVTTLLTVLTALGIFQHGGFGPPHVFALLTLLALAVGFAASKTGVLARRSRVLQAVCYSTTMLLHLIPGLTETLTRLPLGDPLFANAQDPRLRPIFGALFVLYALGLFLQLRWLRAEISKPPPH